MTKKKFLSRLEFWRKRGYFGSKKCDDEIKYEKIKFMIEKNKDLVKKLNK